MMKWPEKVAQLRQYIERDISPLIDRDYWLLETPFYANAGDTFIWQGELDFLKRLPYRCLGMGSSCEPIPELPERSLVLFQGGGNFGDVWPAAPTYRRNVMEKNPTCRFVILPQTVWYEDLQKKSVDAEFFKRYDVTVCARDLRSYEILEDLIPSVDQRLLVPDMAFFMDVAAFRRATSPTGSLLLMRSDKERMLYARMESLVEKGVTVGDWPSMMEELKEDALSICAGHPELFGGYYRKFVEEIYRPYLLTSAINYLDSFLKIATTRLHGCILAGLLNKKEVEVFDNAYGKNKSFYDTWLSDCEDVRLISREESLSQDQEREIEDVVSGAYRQVLGESQNAHSLAISATESWKAYDTVAADRDAAYAKVAEAWKAYDAVVADRDAAYAKVAEAWKAYDAVVADRDAAYAKVAEAWKAYDEVVVERDAAYAKAQVVSTIRG